MTLKKLKKIMGDHKFTKEEEKRKKEEAKKKGLTYKGTFRMSEETLKNLKLV